MDRVTGWGWISLSSEAAVRAVARLRKLAVATGGPFLAAGNPLPGVDGFRRSHQQAQDARKVALTAGAGARRVTLASDPGLSVAALLGNDLDAASAWIGDILGPLASQSESDDRLRETLLVYLRSGSSYTAAAEELHLHFNSVKYRVQRGMRRVADR